MLCFIRWEPVYYHVDGPDFPTNTHEQRGCFVGIADNNGVRMTIALLCCPNSCSKLVPPAPNLQPNPIDGEMIRYHVKFRGDITLVSIVRVGEVAIVQAIRMEATGTPPPPLILLTTTVAFRF